MPPAIRVLVAYWGRYGGGGKLTAQLVPALAADSRFAVSLSLSRQAEHFAESQALQVPLWPIDTFQTMAGLIGRTLLLPLTAWRFRAALRRNRIDAVVVVMPHVWDRVFQIVAQAAGVHWLVWAHDADQHPGERSRLLDWLQGREFVAADAVITASRFVAARLQARRKLAADRIVQLFLPVLTYPGAVQKARPRKPFRFLFFGRLLPYKGVPLLLEAFAKLRAHNIDATLTIAGDGAIDAPVASITQPGVTLQQGWIEPDQIGAVLAAADAMVVPYVEASQSGVIAAAYGAGLPVIATPVGGLAEQVVPEQTGLVTTAIDAASLADAMRRLVEDGALYARCAAGAAQQQDTNSWKHFASLLGDAIENVVTRRPADASLR
ncbi:glycosyltransferase family 4 protein [Roseiterribacter gracilis]